MRLINFLEALSGGLRFFTLPCIVRGSSTPFEEARWRID